MKVSIKSEKIIRWPKIPMSSLLEKHHVISIIWEMNSEKGSDNKQIGVVGERALLEAKCVLQHWFFIVRQSTSLPLCFPVAVAHKETESRPHYAELLATSLHSTFPLVIFVTKRALSPNHVLFCAPALLPNPVCCQ
jgi:hypothetical protein